MRRSARGYSGGPLSLQELAQLLWASQGTTAEWGGRAAPSAGALYPLEVYAVVGEVSGLDAGVYRYVPAAHELAKLADGDRRTDLADAALRQSSVRDAAVDIVFAAVYKKATKRYGQRGVRYVHLDVGHAAQNLCLQATALGLGTVPVGAFDDEAVKKAAGLHADEDPVYILPVGRR